MKYLLDISNNTKESLLFWITKYTKYKINTLSHAKVKNKDVVTYAIKLLSKTPESIEDIDNIVKKLRREGGFHGVGTFFTPVKTLYDYIDNNMLSSLKEIDEDFIVDFLTSSTASLSDATKKNYKNAIINFFSYLSKNNENDPNSGIGFIYTLDIGRWQGLRGKAGNKIPDYLSEKEIQILLEYIDSLVTKYEIKGTEKQRRSSVFYALLIRIILFTGMRISEVLSIRSEQIKTVVIDDKQFLVFKIFGKGNNNREVLVKLSYLQPSFQKWKDCYNTQQKGFLLDSPTGGKRANPSAVSIKISKLLKDIDLVKNKNGAHLLRHTFGTFLYAKTKDLALVQDALGHNDPKTTRVYTHIGKEGNKRIAEAFLEL